MPGGMKDVHMKHGGRVQYIALHVLPFNQAVGLIQNDRAVACTGKECPCSGGEI
jgi:hypothetical protein